MVTPSSAEPSPPVVYAPAATGPRVTAVPLGSPIGGRAPWKLAVSFRCDEQPVAGSLTVRVGRDGRFEAHTDKLVTSADVGSETDTTIRGRLTDSGGNGAIDAAARAYDNAGTTSECTKRGIEWRSVIENDPAAQRVDRFLPTDGDTIAVTADAVFVDKDRGDKASTVRRLEPGTGKVTWSRRVGDADRVAAGPDRAWVADGGKGRVLGLEARTGRIVSSTEVGPGRFDAIAPGAKQPIAVTVDAVWVATAQGLMRLDPATGERTEQVPVGAVEGVVAGPSGVIAAVAVPGADGRPVATRIARIDPTTGVVIAEAQLDEVPDLVAVAADATAITVAPFEKRLARFDAQTLAPLDALEVIASGANITSALPGAWAETGDGLVAIDESGALVLRVRGIAGELAATGSTIWVLDHGAGGLVRVQGG